MKSAENPYFTSTALLCEICTMKSYHSDLCLKRKETWFAAHVSAWPDREDADTERAKPGFSSGVFCLMEMPYIIS